MRLALAAAVAACTIALTGSCSGPNDPHHEVAIEPALRISIDTVSSQIGEYISVPIRCLPMTSTSSIDSIGTFDLVIYYDDSLMTFLEAVKGDAISDWEYFTYRQYPIRGYSKSGSFRIVGVRDVDNGGAPPIGQLIPNGELAHLRFITTSNRDKVGVEQRIGYWFGACTDNTMSDAAEPNTLHMALSVLPSSGASGYFDTLNCPRRYELVPDIEFVAGAIEILAPPDDPSDPGITVSIDNPMGLDGDTVEAHVRINYGLVPPYVPSGIGGMQFSILYDTAAIHVLDVVRGDQLEGWEYFIWRDRPVNGWTRFHSHLTIFSILEAINGVPATGKTRPKGDLAVVRFVLNRDLAVTDACRALTFFSAEPDDNILADLHGTVGYLPFPGQSGIEFPLSYDPLDCGPIDSCEMIVEYLKSGCPE